VCVCVCVCVCVYYFFIAVGLILACRLCWVCVRDRLFVIVVVRVHFRVGSCVIN